MAKLKHILTFISIFIFVIGNATEITVNGFAKGYEGKQITLNLFQEYFTYKQTEVSKSTINKDGSFSLIADLTKTQKGTIQIEELSGLIYLSPSTKSYTIYFPKTSSSPRTLRKIDVRLVFDELPKNDINTLILEYNFQLDKLLYQDTLREFSFLKDTSLSYRLDTFKTRIKNYYSDVKDQYFYNYVRYSINSINELLPNKQNVKQRFITYNQQIENEPILYKNDMYMEFFHQFYNSGLSAFSRDTRINLNQSISEGNYEQAMTLIESHFIKRNDIKELILMKTIADAYTSNQIKKSGALRIFNHISKQSKSTDNQIISRNYIYELSRLERGFNAPQFSFTSKQGDEINNETFKGKYLYVSFFATWSGESIAEMTAMQDIQKRYGKMVSFLSISLDKDTADYDYFLKRYPHFNWHITHFGNDYRLLEKFNIKTLPSYILIDPDGKILQAPAHRPIPVREYPSVDKTFHDIKNKNRERKEFNVGRR